MKIEVKLIDPKYCNSCPCLKGLNTSTYCQQYGKEVKEKIIDRQYKFIRLKKCIQQNGN